MGVNVALVAGESVDALGLGVASTFVGIVGLEAAAIALVRSSRA